eukprot:933953-Rhodomonas_salina.6
MRTARANVAVDVRLAVAAMQAACAVARHGALAKARARSAADIAQHARRQEHPTARQSRASHSKRAGRWHPMQGQHWTLIVDSCLLCQNRAPVAHLNIAESRRLARSR